MSARGILPIALSAVLIAAAAGVATAGAAVTPKCRGKKATIVGTNGADDLEGTKKVDVIVALGGDDRIEGGTGTRDGGLIDLICGGAGNDTFSDGGNYWGKFDGGPGTDTMTGNSTILLGNLGNSGSYGDTANVPLYNVENAIGTPLGDTLAGGPGTNVLTGGGGPDWFLYYPADTGDDIWDGGEGDDRADYTRAQGAVSADLGGGTASIAGYGTDSLVGIDDITGSYFADMLTGSDLPNNMQGANTGVSQNHDFAGDELSGLGGDDFLRASAGPVTMHGGDGNDQLAALGDAGQMLDGGDGNDIIGGSQYVHTGTSIYVGGPGDDWIDGSGGNDVMSGDAGADLIEASYGDDTIDGGANQDTADGGRGRDTCSNVESFRGCASGEFDDFDIGDPLTPSRSSDVQLAVALDEDPTGKKAVYEFTVTNHGPDSLDSPALKVHVAGIVDLPDGCVGDGPTGATCGPGALDAGEQFRIKLDVTQPLDIAHVAVAIPAGPHDPNWSNNVATFGGPPPPPVCQVDPPPAGEIDLTKRELTEVLRDERNNLPLGKWIDRLEAAIAAIEADATPDPDQHAENEAVLAELNALLDEATAQRSPRVSLRMQEDDGLSDNERQLLENAACGALDEAKSSLETYLEENVSEDHGALFNKLDTLADILNAEEPTDEEEQEYLGAAIEDLVARLAKDKLDGKTDEEIAEFTGPYKDFSLAAFDILKDGLSGELGPNKLKHLEATLKAASDAFGSSDTTEFIELSFKFLTVIRGEATPQEEYEILKETVANLANRLTTRIFGTAILSTPQARAAMLGFQIGLALGERIARDLELIFKGSLVEDCTKALATAQGKSNPVDVDYSRPDFGIVSKTSGGIIPWHLGWRCDIVDNGHTRSRAGGVVQATRPTDEEFEAACEEADGYVSCNAYYVVWRITTHGRGVILWDPACAIARGCRF